MLESYCTSIRTQLRARRSTYLKTIMQLTRTIKVHFAIIEKFLFSVSFEVFGPLEILLGILGVFLPVPSNDALTEVRLWEEH